MMEIVQAKTEFVVQADKGCHDWYDFNRQAGNNESIGRSNLYHIHGERPFERHRLVRRVIIDTELDLKDITVRYDNLPARNPEPQR